MVDQPGWQAGRLKLAGSWLQGVELELYSPEELLRGPHQRGQRQHQAAQPTAPQHRQQHRPPDMAPPETGPSGGAGWFSLPWFGSHHGPSENGRMSSPGGSSSDGDSGSRPAALYPPPVSGCVGAHARGMTTTCSTWLHSSGAEHAAHSCALHCAPVGSMAAAVMRLPLAAYGQTCEHRQHTPACRQDGTNVQASIPRFRPTLTVVLVSCAADPARPWQRE